MNWLIIVAGGKGERAKLGYNKVFARLGKKTILEQTLEAFEKNNSVNKIIISIGRDDLKKAKEIVKKRGFNKVVDFILADDSRQSSTLKVLELKAAEIQKNDLVGVHNAVNPYVLQKEIEEVFKSAGDFGAALLAQAAKDTVKITDIKGFVANTPLRELSWYAQTPQVATYQNMLKAHKEAKRRKFLGTDDAQLLERIGIKPKIVACTNKNFKITFKEDLVSAKNILKTWED